MPKKIERKAKMGIQYIADDILISNEHFHLVQDLRQCKNLTPYGVYHSTLT